MKSGRILLLAVVVAASLALTAQAAETNEGKITLSSAAQIGSQQLKPGDYTVQWEGQGPSVQVKFLQRNKVVATSNANLTQAKPASGHDEVHLRVQDNGSKTVESIDFAKRGVNLMFGEAAASSGQ